MCVSIYGKSLIANWDLSFALHGPSFIESLRLFQRPLVQDQSLAALAARAEMAAESSAPSALALRLLSRAQLRSRRKSCSVLAQVSADRAINTRGGFREVLLPVKKVLGGHTHICFYSAVGSTRGSHNPKVALVLIGSTLVKTPSAS
eukprot:2121859-Amphidinium_carterae.1